jgi:DNA-binding PadR family transcriptional regulator
MDGIKRRFAKSFLDILILQIINTTPTWGYDIIKKTQEQYKVKLRHGALYPMLQQLETERLVISRRELQKGRVRKVYQITDKGTQLLDSYYELIDHHLKSRRIQGEHA